MLQLLPNVHRLYTELGWAYDKAVCACASGSNEKVSYVSEYSGNNTVSCQIKEQDAISPTTDESNKKRILLWTLW